MKRIIAIGGSHAETVAFARQIDEKNLRYVTNRDFIKGLRPDELHLLPGYFTRRDRHAVGAEVKVMERKNRQLIVTTWVKVQGSFVEALDVNNLDVEVTPQVEALFPIEGLIVTTDELAKIEEELAAPPEIVAEIVVAAKPRPAKPKPAAKKPAARKPAAKKAPAKKPVMDQPEIDFDTVRNDLTQDVPTVSNTTSHIVPLRRDKGTISAPVAVSNTLDTLDTPIADEARLIENDFFDFLDGK